MSDFTHLAISASDESKGLVHKMREIVDGKVEMETNSNKDLLNISIGVYSVSVVCVCVQSCQPVFFLVICQKKTVW